MDLRADRTPNSPVARPLRLSPVEQLARLSPVAHPAGLSPVEADASPSRVEADASPSRVEADASPSPVEADASPSRVEQAAGLSFPAARRKHFSRSEPLCEAKPARPISVPRAPNPASPFAQLRLLLTLAVALLLCACEKPDPNLVQGYIEGEFVYVAAPAGGQLTDLAVAKGTEVAANAPLFSLDATPEKSARDEAARRVAQARANLEDARQGQRPTEIQALDAQLAEARAALLLAEREFDRQSELVKSGVAAQRDLDNARSQRDQARQQVAQLTARIETAKLGARSDQIAAAEQVVLAQEAALAGIDWNLAQKSQRAPMAALVHDTLFRTGDWVKPGTPVVVLLPPGNVKVRAFVSQTQLGSIQLGDTAQVSVDGVPQPYSARINYIAPRAEYTPPVIYSQKMREKLVFMIELSVAPDVAKKLHPGQPVDVRLSPHHG